MITHPPATTPALSAIAAIIVAAGRGTRIGGDIPKQYRGIGGRMVLAHTLAAFGCSSAIDRIVSVIHPDDAALYAAAATASGLPKTRLTLCHGGASRQASVRAGLTFLAQSGFPDDGIVLIHDAARPFLSEAVLLRAIIAAGKSGAAIPVLPIADTLAQIDPDGRLAANPDRARMRIVQTPQAFHFTLIRDAHAKAAQDERHDFTDDAGLARAFGAPVDLFDGDPALFKITLESDLQRAERHLRGATSPTATRSGIGYDVHAFAPGSHVMLGGIAVPHSHALLGHSDADPVLHALTDALLGTIGDGDIGQHFPPSDPRWRGAASRVFLEDAARRVRERGGRIVNVDVTIVCEAPKIGPHRLAMQAMIATILALPGDGVGVKATTSEGLGFTGRKEGIAALAIANVAFG